MLLSSLSDFSIVPTFWFVFALTLLTFDTLKHLGKKKWHTIIAINTTNQDQQFHIHTYYESSHFSCSTWRDTVGCSLQYQWHPKEEERCKGAFPFWYMSAIFQSERASSTGVYLQCNILCIVLSSAFVVLFNTGILNLKS